MKKCSGWRREATATMDELTLRWRAEATILRSRSAGVQAEVLESCAAELEAWQKEKDLEALTLEQAVTESGYSYSALQKKIAAGELKNVGTKGSPRVRRGDLPKKTKRDTGGIADRILNRAN
jgi:hypothetical protein